MLSLNTELKCKTERAQKIKRNEIRVTTTSKDVRNWNVSAIVSCAARVCTNQQFLSVFEYPYRQRLFLLVDICRCRVTCTRTSVIWIYAYIYTLTFVYASTTHMRVYIYIYICHCVLRINAITARPTPAKWNRICPISCLSISSIITIKNARSTTKFIQFSLKLVVEANKERNSSPAPAERVNSTCTEYCQKDHDEKL